MKTNQLAKLLAAAGGLFAFAFAGDARITTSANAVLPPSFAVTAIAVVAGPGANPAGLAELAPSLDFAPAQWADVKDCSYEMRAQFFAGLKRLEARVEEQHRELLAKRATLNGTIDTKAWDFAMKEMDDAQSNLKAMGEELRKAAPETWEQQKDKVGVAWVRTQDAFGKVKASTTS